jgi:hypothetical protein
VRIDLVAERNEVVCYGQPTHPEQWATRNFAMTRDTKVQVFVTCHRPHVTPLIQQSEILPTYLQQPVTLVQVRKLAITPPTHDA